MPYIPVTREERPHRFLPYPEGHVVKAPICVRCGLTREQGNHGDSAADSIRMFDRLRDSRVWSVFGRRRESLGGIDWVTRCYRCGTRRQPIRKRPQGAYICDTCWGKMT